MITFSCETCGKSFTVADELAGRKAKCKACGSAIVVPDPQAADDFEVSDWLAGADLPSAPTPPERKKKSRTTLRKEKPPVRTRRLIADAEMLTKALHGFPLIQLHKKAGNPPELYQIIYHVRGLVRGPDSDYTTPFLGVASLIWKANRSALTEKASPQLSKDN